MRRVLGFLFLTLVTLGSARAATPTAADSGDVVMIPALKGSANCTRVSISNLGKPTFTLIPKEQGARTGKVWVRSGWNGICIQGEVNGAAPQWATKPSGLLGNDHVEVWLATAPRVAMPLVGWGNQFGEAKLKSPDGCATVSNEFFQGVGAVDEMKCRKWYSEQFGYRAWLRRLFMRQWAIGGPDHSRVQEEFASLAWRHLKATYSKKDLPAKLKPRRLDEVKAFASKVKQGYKFAVFIPYSAFPPLPHLELRDLWLMVDVFRSAPAGRKTGPYSTTSARRVWGEPATFNHVELENPVRYVLSPCEASLTSEAEYDDELPAWFFPAEPKSASDHPILISKDLALVNPSAGDLYTPAGVSPGVETHSRFWKQFGAHEWVCGPRLGVRSGGVTRWAVPIKKRECTTWKISSNNTGKSCWTQVTYFDVDKRGLNAKVLEGGDVLVRSGPYFSKLNPYGTGQCGECTVAHLKFYTMSVAGKAGKALDLNPVLSGDNGWPMDAKFSISPDWKTVTEFDQYDGKSGWTSTKYCFDGTTYKKCGGSKLTKLPNLPHGR